MSSRNQRICIWSGPVFIAIWLIGYWGFAGLVPPPSPDDDAAEIAQLFKDDTNSIRFGLLLTMLASTLICPFSAAIGAQLKAVEGRPSPMVYTQMVLGGLLVLLFVLPMMILEACAFRPGRDPNDILLLSDLAWLMFIGAYFTFFFQLLAIGIIVLQDRSAAPTFPRWVAYFHFWVASLSLPGSCLYFVKDGPLAWNGAFAWWIPASIFIVWMVTMTCLMLRNVTREESNNAEQASPRPVRA